MMSEPLTPERERELLVELASLARARSETEEALAGERESAHARAEGEYEAARDKLQQRYETERAALEQEHGAASRTIGEGTTEESSRLQSEFDRARRDLRERLDLAADAARREQQDALWEVQTVYEATRKGPPRALDEARARCRQEKEAAAVLRTEAVQLLVEQRQWRDRLLLEPVADDRREPPPAKSFGEGIESARQELAQLAAERLPKLFAGAAPWALFAAWFAIGALPTGLLVGWRSWSWPVVGGIAGVVGTLAVGLWAWPRARRVTDEGFRRLQAALGEAESATEQRLDAAEETCRVKSAALVATRDRELDLAEARCREQLAGLERERTEETARLEEDFPGRLADVDARRSSALAEADARFPRRQRELADRYEDDLAELRRHRDELRAATDAALRDRFAAMADAWQGGLERFRAAVGEIESRCDALFPDWESTDWENRSPSAEVPPAIRLGSHTVDLATLPGGLSRHATLRPETTRYALPALLPFPARPALLIEGEGPGRQAAVAVLQNLALRLLTSLPAGKVRFTICDPVGLGENFAALMHLADYDPRLIAHRIWTEPEQIEGRLADLTAHMEKVIQKYLRSDFATIQHYNEHAGEVAEPYQVLVAANFPAGFSEAAARRLVSIAQSGPRCGVALLLSVDRTLELPHNFDLADLREQATCLVWEEGGLLPVDPLLKQLPLELEAPPSAPLYTRIVRAAGERAADAGRVEVPFSSVLPADEAWWQEQNDEAIEVPIGRAGATRLQSVELGHGTSQHVLVAGKTGSGKSTLLHALVTSAAIRYAPDQVELYLVDFKKGVEFATYARHRLPHARVVAIESEREFGLSVLERLDDELKRRGDLFRQVGAQDLAAARGATGGDPPLPRVLLVVDEFQELFVEDDKLAQDAALLLDRLVRQGRAFGIHVLLGSQTLSGAYSLPRSTLGQMAVRIALQCSDADAHLILSEENTAARLLQQPGEAIYNDAGGLLAGNHPFQAVWLSEGEREGYLQRIRAMAEERGVECPPQIVFAGNVPPRPDDNPLLTAALADGNGAAPPRAWLGAAVAIKDPTSVLFAPEAGRNLLIVGRHDVAALGLLTAAAVSLLASADRSGGEQRPTRLVVLDGSRADAPHADTFAALATPLPHAVRIATPREAMPALADVASEVRRRLEQDDAGPPLFLVIYDLARFRELRQAEDEFAFTRHDDDAASSPARQLAEVIREGPAVGVHLLAWCDSAAAAQRAFDRHTLREMQLRVVFQMSGNDSSQLIDTPVAARLGLHRALLYEEDRGRLEKFRPYAVPEAAWLADVARQLGKK